MKLPPKARTNVKDGLKSLAELEVGQAVHFCLVRVRGEDDEDVRAVFGTQASLATKEVFFRAWSDDEAVAQSERPKWFIARGAFIVDTKGEVTTLPAIRGNRVVAGAEMKVQMKAMRKSLTDAGVVTTALKKVVDGTFGRATDTAKLDGAGKSGSDTVDDEADMTASKSAKSAEVLALVNRFKKVGLKAALTALTDAATEEARLRAVERVRGVRDELANLASEGATLAKQLKAKTLGSTRYKDSLKTLDELATRAQSAIQSVDKALGAPVDDAASPQSNADGVVESGKLTLIIAAKSNPMNFAFVPHDRTPLLMLRKQGAVPLASAARVAEARELPTSDIWVGRVQVTDGSYVFTVNDALSKGTPRVAKMATQIKRLAKLIGYPPLANAAILDARHEQEAAKKGLGDDALKDKRGRYKDVDRALATLQTQDLDDEKRLGAMGQMRRSATGWLKERLAGGKKPVSEAAMDEMFDALRVSLASTGEPPSPEELEVAAEMLSRRATAARKLWLGDDLAGRTKGHATLLDVQEDLELLLETLTGVRSDALTRLRKILRAIESLDLPARPPAADEPAVTGFTRDDRRGGLRLSDDVESVAVEEDPGVKMFFREEPKFFSDVELTKPMTGDGFSPEGVHKSVSRGTHCTVRATSNPDAMEASAYQKNDALSYTNLASGFVATTAVKHHRQKRSHEDLDRDLPLFNGMPKASDVNQGALGNCYLLASLAALAAKHPRKLVDAMRDNGDQTVTVRFFAAVKSEDPQAPVTFVPRLVRVRKSVHRKAMAVREGSRGDVAWVQMFEKAWAIAGRELGMGDRSVSYAGSEGGYMGHVFQALLGQVSTTDQSDAVPEPPMPSVQDPVPAELVELIGERMAKGLAAALGDKRLPHGSGADDVALDKALQALGVKGQLKASASKDFRDFADNQTKRAKDMKKGSESEAKFLASAQRALVFADAIDRGELETDLDAIRGAYLRALGVAKKIPGPIGTGRYSASQIALWEKIRDALAAGKTLGASTPKWEGLTNPFGAEGLNSGLAGQHAYSLMAVHTLERGDKPPVLFVEVRNPWGMYGRTYKDDGQGGRKPTWKLSGTSKIELTDFTRSFDKVEFS